MRSVLLPGALLASLGCVRPAAPVAVPQAHVAAPRIDAGPPSREVRRREPEAAPPEFAEHVSAIDVDGDGRDDLVRAFPILPPSGQWSVAFDDLPPAVVAHRLADGRYALDDEVTRAALRSLCPARPPTMRAIGESASPTRAMGRVPFVEGTFLDGFCHRVWGASLDEAIASVRATAQAAPPDTFPPSILTALIAALREFPVPLELAPLAAAPLPFVRQVPEAPPIALPPVAPRCAAVERANVALATRANAAIDRRGRGEREGHVLLDDVPTCRSTAAGEWAIALDRFRLAITADDHSVHVTGALSWRPRTGASAPGRPEEFAANSYSQNSLALVADHDYDGDGTPELIVHRWQWVEEGGSSSGYDVYTVRAGAIVPYAPAAAFDRIDAIADPDGDGRPDLVLPSPWSVTAPCGYMGEDHLGPSLLAHARPDGTFSTTDDVARAWTLARCERVGSDPATRPDVLDVACARLGGASPEAAVAALQAREPAGWQRLTGEDNGRCLTFQQVAATALVRLPFGR